MTIRGTHQKWVKIDEEDGIGLYRSMADPNLYQVRLRNCERFVRRQFKASSAKQALAKMPEVLEISPPKTEPRIVELAEAFSLALKGTSRRARAQADWHYAVDRFLNWLNENHSGSTHWAALTRQQLREYLETYEGRSANTRRLAMQPIVQTAGFMWREFGFPNVAERLRIGSKLKTAPKAVYLSDVVDFCDWMVENRPRFEEEKALAWQMDLFRLHVTEPLNRAIATGRRRADVQPLYKSAVSTVGCAVQEERASP